MKNIIEKQLDAVKATNDHMKVWSLAFALGFRGMSPLAVLRTCLAKRGGGFARVYQAGAGQEGKNDEQAGRLQSPHNSSLVGFVRLYN